MVIADVLAAAEMCLTEVKGQIAEGGDPREAIRGLRETVELLEEIIEQNGGDELGKQ
jgi:hypothetical protein